MPQYTKADWDKLGKLRIDPRDAEQMGNLAALLRTNQHGLSEAVAKVGTRIADISKFVEGKRRK